MKSRLDFFLVAKNLTKSVRNSEIYPSIAPDHKVIYISLSWSSETPRGPSLWKFNNTLLNDEQYIAMIRSVYVLQKYENLKTELRSIYEDTGRQAMFRSKCRWIENGERPTNIFLILKNEISTKNYR